MAPHEFQSLQFRVYWHLKTPLLKVPFRQPLNPMTLDIYPGSHYFLICIIVKVVLPWHFPQSMPLPWLLSLQGTGIFIVWLWASSYLTVAEVFNFLFRVPVLHCPTFCYILTVRGLTWAVPTWKHNTMCSNHITLYSHCTMSIISHAHTDLCPSCIIKLSHCTFTVMTLHYTYSAPYLQCGILTLHCAHWTLTSPTLYSHYTNPWCMVHVIHCIHALLNWAALGSTLHWCTLTLHYTHKTPPHTTLRCTPKVLYQHWIDLHFIPPWLLYIHNALHP